MLKLSIPWSEDYDERTERFIETLAVDLEFEHSLLSISKWESKYRKSFINAKNLTNEEVDYYVRCMCLTPEVPEGTFQKLTNSDLKALTALIEDKPTATTFREMPGQSRATNEFITSEIIYYWMLQAQIPFTCETWPLERLLTLIRVVAEKNAPKKRIPRSEALLRQRQLNAQRRKSLGSTG